MAAWSRDSQYGGGQFIDSGSVYRKSNDVSLHTFPEKMAQRRLWIHGIQTTRAEWNGQKMATTQLSCSMHFTLESFSSSTRTKWLLGLPCKPVLNPDAVQTLFGENDRTSNLVSDVQRSTARKREVQRVNAIRV
ncbi:hypothetical protein DPMN_006486 [Dreissena polymorpha]|uniref:THAP-type domain-containing protein n=1 Tax=Dreissena polymorpha TaxID=45954 RepID=A0A9D4MSH7_DREPO|nr:hypothetical protein DPMN_006486 [Dreissena polymorpha]